MTFHLSSLQKGLKGNISNPEAEEMMKFSAGDFEFQNLKEGN